MDALSAAIHDVDAGRNSYYCSCIGGDYDGHIMREESR